MYEHNVSKGTDGLAEEIGKSGLLNLHPFRFVSEWKETKRKRNESKRIAKAIICLRKKSRKVAVSMFIHSPPYLMYLTWKVLVLFWAIFSQTSKGRKTGLSKTGFLTKGLELYRYDSRPSKGLDESHRDPRNVSERLESYRHDLRENQSLKNQSNGLWKTAVWPHARMTAWPQYDIGPNSRSAERLFGWTTVWPYGRTPTTNHSYSDLRSLLSLPSPRLFYDLREWLSKRPSRIKIV